MMEISEEFMDEAGSGDRGEADLSLVISQLIGTWSYPGNHQSIIEITEGEAPDEIVARDLTQQHWSNGSATVRVAPRDDLLVYIIDIHFDTGVSVSGVISDDGRVIDWDNNTTWLRES